MIAQARDANAKRLPLWVAKTNRGWKSLIDKVIVPT